MHIGYIFSIFLFDLNYFTDINHCEKDSCLNGGTCIDGVVSFECRCREGYFGKRCESGLFQILFAI